MQLTHSACSASLCRAINDTTRGLQVRRWGACQVMALRCTCLTCSLCVLQSCSFWKLITGHNRASARRYLGMLFLLCMRPLVAAMPEHETSRVAGS